MWLKNLALSTLAVFVPIQAALIVVGVLTFVDLALGIAAAMKRKEKITSSGFRRTVTKLFVYEMAVVLGFLAETYLINGVMPICKIITGLIGVTELKSILENLDDINGTPVFQSILKMLNSDNNEPK